MVMIEGGNLSYVQASSPTRRLGVYADILYGDRRSGVRQFKANDEVAHRLALLVAEATPAETSAMADSCRIERGTSGTRLLHFRPPGGEEIEVSLLRALGSPVSPAARGR
jgi:hypothetical protein